jgi:hypothetical protein
MAEIIQKRIIKVDNGTLKNLCNVYGIKLKDLSEKLGINYDHLRKFDTGKRAISWELWLKATEELEKVEKENATA